MRARSRRTVMSSVQNFSLFGSFAMNWCRPRSSAVSKKKLERVTAGIVRELEEAWPSSSTWTIPEERCGPGRLEVVAEARAKADPRRSQKRLGGPPSGSKAS